MCITIRPFLFSIDIVQCHCDISPKIKVSSFVGHIQIGYKISYPQNHQIYSFLSRPDIKPKTPTWKTQVCSLARARTLKLWVYLSVWYVVEIKLDRHHNYSSALPDLRFKYLAMVPTYNIFIWIHQHIIHCKNKCRDEIKEPGDKLVGR